MRLIKFGCAAVAMSFCASAVRAESLLNLNQLLPNVAAERIDVKYEITGSGPGAIGKFTAIGRTQAIDDVGSLTNFSSAQRGLFSLTAFFDPTSGQIFLDHIDDSFDPMLTVDWKPSGSTTEVLFSSNQLSRFGSGSEDRFEFEFVKTGGTLGPVGASIGVLLDGINIPQFIDPTFTANFDNEALMPGLDVGVANVFVTPVPAAAYAGLVLLAGMGLLRARGRKASAL